LLLSALVRLAIAIQGCRPPRFDRAQTSRQFTIASLKAFDAQLLRRDQTVKGLNRSHRHAVTVNRLIAAIIVAEAKAAHKVLRHRAEVADVRRLVEIARHGDVARTPRCRGGRREANLAGRPNRGIRGAAVLVELQTARRQNTAQSSPKELCFRRALWPRAHLVACLFGPIESAFAEEPSRCE